MRVKRKHWLGLGVLVVLALFAGACLLLRPPSLTAEEQRLVGEWKLAPNSFLPTLPNEEIRWSFSSNKRYTGWIVNTKTGQKIEGGGPYNWSIQNGDLVFELVAFPASLFHANSTGKFSISSWTDDTIELTSAHIVGYKVVLHRIPGE